MQKNKTNKKSVTKTKNIPAAKAQTLKRGPPNLVSQRDGRIEVTNHEYLADITCTSSFTSSKYAINPGLASTFPWLSNIANNYEFYQFKELTVEFRPFVGTSSSGSVMMAFDFDAEDAAPLNKQRFMSYLTSVQGAVYNPMNLRAESRDLSKFGVQKFTRPSAVPANTDVKTYDVANLYIATDGGNGTSSGSLYLRYRVVLMTPHSPSEYPWESSAVVSTSGTSTKTAPFQGATLANADVTDKTVLSSTLTDLTIKAGEYLISSSMYGTGLTNTQFSTMISSMTPGFAQGNIDRVVDAAGTLLTTRHKVSCPQNFTLTFTPNAAWSTLGTVNWLLTPFKNSLV